MRAFKADDAQWQKGRTFSYVYFAGDEILDTVKAAYHLYFSENALNPSAFPSLRKLETEVIAMCASLFHGDELTTGTMTSGGTESILMAVKTARAWAKANKPTIVRPEIILPATAHPAFHKAAYYFELAVKVIPVGTDYRVSAADMEKAIGSNTVMLVASAPSYPQGVMDPVGDVAALAKRHQLLCHVDACVGGFMLPFLKEAGYPIPDFDFSVDGVTSISADIHKYGYAAKGASVVMYKNAELRKHQFYVYTDWSGGIYGSPSMTGTRPGGAIAAAWAALHHIGWEGYVSLAKQTKETTDYLRHEVAKIEGIKVLGNPDMTIFAIASDEFDIYEVGDELGIMGWWIDRQQTPASLHCTITPAIAATKDDFLHDLKKAVGKAKRMSVNKLAKTMQLQIVRGLTKVLPKKWMDRFQKLATKYAKVGGKRSAAMYGMMGELKETGNLEEVVKGFLDKLFSR